MGLILNEDEMEQMKASIKKHSENMMAAKAAA